MKSKERVRQPLAHALGLLLAEPRAPSEYSNPQGLLHIGLQDRTDLQWSPPLRVLLGGPAPT